MFRSFPKALLCVVVASVAIMVTIAHFIESLDLERSKKNALRQFLNDFQIPLSAACQAEVLQSLLEGEGFPASFLPYDKAKVFGALNNLGECRHLRVNECHTAYVGLLRLACAEYSSL